jgi:hypothetical protein
MCAVGRRPALLPLFVVTVDWKEPLDELASEIGDTTRHYRRENLAIILIIRYRTEIAPPPAETCPFCNRLTNR